MAGALREHLGGRAHRLARRGVAGSEPSCRHHSPRAGTRDPAVDAVGGLQVAAAEGLRAGEAGPAGPHGSSARRTAPASCEPERVGQHQRTGHVEERRPWRPPTRPAVSPAWLTLGAGGALGTGHEVGFPTWTGLGFIHHKGPERYRIWPGGQSRPQRGDESQAWKK